MQQNARKCEKIKIPTCFGDCLGGLEAFFCNFFSLFLLVFFSPRSEVTTSAVKRKSQHTKKEGAGEGLRVLKIRHSITKKKRKKQKNEKIHSITSPPSPHPPHHPPSPNPPPPPRQPTSSLAKKSDCTRRASDSCSPTPCVPPP